MKRTAILLLLAFVICALTSSGYSYAAVGKAGCELGKDENRSVMLDKYLQGQKAFNNKDFAKALTLIKPAAEAGNPNAQYLLATMYDFGRGVPTNHEEANAWYLKAAQQGNDDAQYNLGISYQIGEGITKNMDMSVCWVARAAANGDEEGLELLKRYAEKYPAAQYALAQIYRNGVTLHNNPRLYPHEHDNTTIKPDMAAYKYWIEKAAANKYPEAMKELGR